MEGQLREQGIQMESRLRKLFHVHASLRRFTWNICALNDASISRSAYRNLWDLKDYEITGR